MGGNLLADGLGGHGGADVKRGKEKDNRETCTRTWLGDGEADRESKAWKVERRNGTLFQG